MKVNSINNYQNQTFNGYQNLKMIDGRLVCAKKGEKGSFKLFIAGGKEVDRKVAEANKNIQKKSDKTASVKDSKPCSLTLFIAELRSAFGFKFMNK